MCSQPDTGPRHPCLCLFRRNEREGTGAVTTYLGQARPGEGTGLG